MRPASVGFHCPRCVAEARGSQRAPRTIAGGLLPAQVGRVTVVLIVANAAVWLLIQATGGGASALVRELALASTTVTYRGFGTVTGVDDGAWWRLLTSAFVHVQFVHLLLNMLALWIFGPLLERTLGYARFIALYATCALAGSVAAIWLAGPLTLTYGASGAIFGLFGCAVVLLRSRGYDVSSWLVVLGINLVLTFTISSISWQGHLGGLAMGALLGLVFARVPRERRQLWHPLTFAACWAVLLGAVALHAAG